MIRPTFIFVVLFASCRMPEPQHVTLASDVELPAATWVTVNSPTPLLTPGDNNEICFVPAAHFAVEDSVFGIRTLSGHTASLAGKVFRPDGRADSLENLSIIWDSVPRLCLGLRVGDAPSPTYTSAALRSSEAVQFREVYWLSTYK